MIKKFDVVPLQAFMQQYYQNLQQPSCLPKCMEELCGGWTQETLKQNVQKITKKNQAPLPLFFDSPAILDQISNKKQALQHTFALFDTRGLGRIDATELFSVMLFCSKGEMSMIFQNLVEIFGQDKNTLITADEFFFFMDSFFRGLSKVLLTRSSKQPEKVNKRLNPEDIRKIVNSVFKGKQQLLKEEFVNNVQASDIMQELVFHIIERLQQSMEYSREEALKNMKINLEVKKVITYLILEVEKTLKPKK